MTGDEWWEKIKQTVTKLGEGRSHKSIPPSIPKPATATSVIDLHGFTVQQAYDKAMEFIDNSSCRTITIITGKSGQIRREFPEWLNLNGRVSSYTIISDGGAFNIKLLSK